MQAFNFFEVLPFEILSEITSYLGTHDGCNLKLVCKLFYKFYQNEITEILPFSIIPLSDYKDMNPRKLYVDEVLLMICEDDDDEEELEYCYESTDCIVNIKYFGERYFNIQLSHMTNLRVLHLVGNYTYPIQYLSKLNLSVLVIGCNLYSLSYNNNSRMYEIEDENEYFDLNYYRRLFVKLITEVKADVIKVSTKCYKSILLKLGYVRNSEKEFVLKG